MFFSFWFCQSADEPSCRFKGHLGHCSRMNPHIYLRKQHWDDTTLLGEGLLRLKSTFRVEGSLDGINGHLSVTKASLQENYWRWRTSAGWPREGWTPPGLLVQDKLRMNWYLSGFQPKYRHSYPGNLSGAPAAQWSYDHTQFRRNSCSTQESVRHPNVIRIYWKRKCCLPVCLMSFKGNDSWLEDR